MNRKIASETLTASFAELDLMRRHYGRQGTVAEFFVWLGVKAGERYRTCKQVFGAWYQRALDEKHHTHPLPHFISRMLALFRKSDTYRDWRRELRDAAIA